MTLQNINVIDIVVDKSGIAVKKRKKLLGVGKSSWRFFNAI